MQIRQPYLYLSYADGAFAQQLRRLLEKSHFNVWMDAESHPSEEWLILIEGQIETCTAFLVILTPAAYQSERVAEEISLAEQYGRPIIAVLREGESWSRLVNIPVVDMRGRRGNRLPASLNRELCQYFDCPDDQRNGRRWWRWW